MHVLHLLTRCNTCYTQVSSDFYEGIQPATFQDIESIIELLKPLVRAGVVVDRSPEKLMEEISDYTVVVRDSKVSSLWCESTFIIRNYFTWI